MTQELRVSDATDFVSSHLLVLAARLTRLLSREVLGTTVSRTEVGVLRALSEQPLRIGELAESEGLAQPTITMLGKRLEQKGLVRRERQMDDQRVVVLSLTTEGAAALERFRAQARQALEANLQQLTPQQVHRLADAIEALQELTAILSAREDVRTAPPA